ncbi:MAG: hypothetical protein IKN43_13605 [Selenomonadaceae bacterium]|nr:hypothetical protein [Selenomonadaceae bacterium]
MLKQINLTPKRAVISIKDANFPAPFNHAPEFSPPARGTWNIVHTGMLLPESHQIYICAAACLRGVILTAAEMGAMDRFSTLEVREADLTARDHESFIIEGITHILNELPKLPRAVLVFTACVHHFLGTNLRYVYKRLRERFPNVDFAECVMDPIRQTKSLTPEERERREIFRLLRPAQKKRQINIAGGNLAIDENSEIIRLIKNAGYKILEFPGLKAYNEFLDMAASSVNIYQHPFFHVAAKELKERLHQDFCYIPIAYDLDEIEAQLQTVARLLNITIPDFSSERKTAYETMINAKQKIGATPIAIDLTFTHRPFHLAKTLAKTYGFNIAYIFSDMVAPEDKEDFLWLKSNRENMRLASVKHADIRLFADTENKKILSLGQKAAYFLNTPYFVNFVEGGGLWGYTGVKKLAELMIGSFSTKKDLRIIEKKAWSAPSCI